MSYICMHGAPAMNEGHRRATHRRRRRYWFFHEAEIFARKIYLAHQTSHDTGWSSRRAPVLLPTIRLKAWRFTPYEAGDLPSARTVAWKAKARVFTKFLFRVDGRWWMLRISGQQRARIKRFIREIAGLRGWDYDISGRDLYLTARRAHLKLPPRYADYFSPWCRR